MSKKQDQIRLAKARRTAEDLLGQIEIIEKYIGILPAAQRNLDALIVQLEALRVLKKDS